MLEELIEKLGLTFGGQFSNICQQDLQYFSKMKNQWVDFPYNQTKLELLDWLKHNYLIRLKP